MPRKATQPTCSEEVRKQLEDISRSRTESFQRVERARIVLACLDGKAIKVIANDFKTGANRVIKWRNRFVRHGIQGLNDESRSGKPPIYGKDFRNKVLATLEEAPPRGFARWDGKRLSERLNSSPDAVWRVLSKERIYLQRQRSWCVSTDPEFASKAADIVAIYLNPPENAIVISVDEKPHIQAIERQTGYVKTKSKKIVSGCKSTYKRHGTLNLFAALEVATGIVHGKLTTEKKRPDFLEFMDSVVAEIHEDKEIHVILDNYCTHKNNEKWLENNKRVHFHFTPTSASWLNMVEVWFSILARNALRGASFVSAEDLRVAIETYIQVSNSNAHPFVWRKREVKGAQLKNTIANLCN